MKKFLRGVVVLLIAVAMVFSTVVLAENTKETIKIGEEVQCNPSIDVEKYVRDKDGNWVDADTEYEALDVFICSELKFKIVVHNDGDCPLFYINIHDRMHESLNS
jgi:hypothetical protein